MISKELLIKSCLSMGISIDEKAILRFDRYAELLIDYNKKVNLTAIKEPEDIVIKHFVDSLCLMKYVDIKDGMSLCDVGTGAGFPGCALLIANPSIKVTLVDSVNKKLEFLRMLVKELGLNAEIVTSRAEDIARNDSYREKFDIVTSRAVAQLNVLAEYSVPLVKVGGVFAPLKAVLSSNEAARGVRAVKMLGCEKISKNIYKIPDGSEREIIVFKKNSSTEIKYPRSFSQISKKPL